MLNIGWRSLIFVRSLWLILVSLLGQTFVPIQWIWHCPTLKELQFNQERSGFNWQRTLISLMQDASWAILSLC